MAAVNLKSLTKKQLFDVFNSVDHILCDNDGVLGVGGILFPGVSDFIKKMRDADKDVKVVTNNTAAGRINLSSRFLKQGVQFTPDDFFTPTCAMFDYLKRTKFSGKVWVMGTDAMQAEFEKEGFLLADSENPRITPVSDTHNYLLSEDPEIKAIVIDISINITCGCIAKAINYLNKDPSIILLFGCTDEVIPISKEVSIIGMTYFQNLVCEVTNKTPLVFGKPSDYFGKYLIGKLNCEPERTLFIGDSLKSDIWFAKNQGFKQILVLSGITTMKDLEICKEAYKPDYYISSIEDLELLLTNFY